MDTTVTMKTSFITISFIGFRRRKLEINNQFISTEPCLNFEDGEDSTLKNNRKRMQVKTEADQKVPTDARVIPTHFMLETD